jgi:uncharacterized SAM-binding protein YcdF (DUF218 family)
MLLSPGAWLAAFCALGGILLALGLRRLGAGFTACGILGFAAVVSLPLDQWALAPLENRFPVPVDTNGYYGILVLGGALETGLTQDRARPSLNAASERLIEFVALARKYPEAKLAFTGGPMPNRPDGPPEADGVRQLFESLGLSSDRVTFESQSLTTHENAVLSARKIKPDLAQRWLLLTSAAHMPRSIGAFRAAGWNVTAYPVGYKTFLDNRLRATRGFGERMALLDIAAHEWLGLLYYRLTGRSAALFPAA